ncbi:MAG TPA: hypothetical protein VLF89_08840 [Candidatus Saccharimonadales bacterium]|nr:hypothetical protein [Candidatus Saccharimonadales bacterium]
MSNLRVVPEESILESIVNPKLDDVAKELLELGIDEITNNELIKKLPIIDLLSAGYKSIIAMNNYLFFKKVVHFLFQQTKITPKERKKWLLKITKEGTRKKIGKITLELIDKIISTKKADILGIIFREHIKGNVTTEEYVTIGEMIESAYLSDLDYFISHKEGDIGELGDEVNHLLSIGFYFRGAYQFGNTIMPKMKPEHSTLGKIIFKILIDNENNY